MTDDYAYDGFNPPDREMPATDKRILISEVYGPVSAQDVERFWSYVDERGPNECWVWKGGGAHFGAFWINGRTVGAHAFSFHLANDGRLVCIPEARRMQPKRPHRSQRGSSRFMVCHTCDNPLCVNSAHLYLGNGTTNAFDRETRGRGFGKHTAGAANGQAKLSEARVRALRKEYGPPRGRGVGRGSARPKLADLARKYCISYGQAHAAIHRRTYANVR